MKSVECSGDEWIIAKAVKGRIMTTRRDEDSLKREMPSKRTELFF